jgi:Flp pilus assembly protein TadD
MLTGLQRFPEAQREYRQAALIARQQGHLPSFTLWHLAGSYYYQGDPRRAADVMKQLADEAATSGDLAVEALALFNSAWLNGQGGRGEVAATQIADLRKLLGSPYMPIALKEHLTAKLDFPGTVER